jgi:hypothetical protein
LGVTFSGGDLAAIDDADEAGPLAHVLLLEHGDSDAAVLWSMVPLNFFPSFCSL